MTVDDVMEMTAEELANFFAGYGVPDSESSAKAAT